MTTKTHHGAVLIGTSAERGAYATGDLLAGQMWVETDTLIIYVWDGTQWVGAGGMPYGEIYVEGIDVGIALAAQDTYYQVLAWSPGGPDGVNGESSNTTPDVSNDHITIDVSGIYFVRWHAACYSAAKTEYEFEIFANGGVDGFPNTENYRTTSTASAVGALSGGGICNLTANDTIELWVERKDGLAVSKTITIRAAVISVMMIG